MARSKKSQTQHDTEVRRIAKGLKAQGFTVEADVSGFPTPGTIGGFRPDVVATSGRRRRIVEVETAESVSSARDQKQQQAFRRAAARSTNTTFTRKVTGKKKR